MPTILSIETSTEVCSVALSSDGYILSHFEDFEGPNHAAILSDFIYGSLEFLRQNEGVAPVGAVAVSIGPGSYTGLRIGLSEAKGLAYGLKVPLIGVGTLDLLAAETMFDVIDFDPERDLFQPMIDARRNEVYTATFDGALNVVTPPEAMILTPDSHLARERKRLIISGNGATKAQKIFGSHSDILYVDNIVPLATGMVSLAEKKYLEGHFLDIAYSVPFYLKEFQTTKPKNRVLK